MFVTQVHSVTQQARLAITLAWVAGYTNTIAVLTCGHVVSHVSGTNADLGRWAAGGGWLTAAFLLHLLATFLLGAFVSGLVTEMGRRRGWDSIYVLPMGIEVALLAAFAIGVQMHDPRTLEQGVRLYVLTGLASAAMGLQNATITRISGGVVRTTHVTGVLTDLGTELASLLLSRKGGSGSAQASRTSQDPLAYSTPPRRILRPALLASILGSFALRAGLAAAAYLEVPRVLPGFEAMAMFPPVLFLVWIIAQDLRRPIAEIEPAEIAGSHANLGLPAGLAVYEVRPMPGRAGRAQRMPNVTAWLERLPPGGAGGCPGPGRDHAD